MIISYGIKAAWRPLFWGAMLFCYIFCFYLGYPFNSAMLAGLILLCLMPEAVLKALRQLWPAAERYCLLLLAWICLLAIAAAATPLFRHTGDFALLRYLASITVHLAIGLALAAVLWQQSDGDFAWILRLIVAGFLLQSLVQLIANAIPGGVEWMRSINPGATFRYGPRGAAICSAPTWNLSLGYAWVMAFYGWHCRCRHAAGWGWRRAFTVAAVLLSLLAGGVLAGRSCIPGFILGWVFAFCSRRAFAKGLAATLALTTLAVAFMATLPAWQQISGRFAPWLFEPLHRTPVSLQILLDMWQRASRMPPADWVWGTGHFEEADGAYYATVDPGSLRFPLFFGIPGYLLLLAGAAWAFLPLLRSREWRVPAAAMLAFLLLAELKATALGYNKMTLSLTFLFSLCALFAQVSKKSYFCQRFQKYSVKD